jgi:hypothetical protein
MPNEFHLFGMWHLGTNTQLLGPKLFEIRTLKKNQSSLISMLGGTIQEPSTQKINLGLLLTDPTKKTPSCEIRGVDF